MLKGALAGAIGGMFGVGFNPIRIIAGGAIGALVTGGDPMMGAMTAGISAGVGACFEISPMAGVFGDVENSWGAALRLSTASGALAGGVTAEIFGGDFGRGALYGAAAAAAEYMVYSALLAFTEQSAVGGPLPNPPPGADSLSADLGYCQNDPVDIDLTWKVDWLADDEGVSWSLLSAEVELTAEYVMVIPTPVGIVTITKQVTRTFKISELDNLPLGFSIQPGHTRGMAIFRGEQIERLWLRNPGLRTSIRTDVVRSLGPVTKRVMGTIYENPNGKYFLAYKRPGVSEYKFDKNRR